MQRALFALLLAGLGSAPAVASAPAPAALQDPGALCREAIRAAEREHRLPKDLLGAIGRVESGRLDPRTGRITPWPWTINAEGEGRHFDSKEEAIAAARALQARGVRVIDVGCMQVNLHHHPTAFAGLEQAFDPEANVRYAASFLKRLQQARGDWEVAAAHYHSTTPERAEAYRLKVLANWPAMAHRLAEEQRRAALVAAWTGGQAAAGEGLARNGFHQRALALSQRPMLHGRESPLLDPVPPLRVVARPPGGRPVFMLEVAEAPPAGPGRR